MISAPSEARPLGVGRFQLGEGPLWSERRGQVLFVDIYGHTLLRYDPATSLLDSENFSQPVCGVYEHDGGDLLVALDDRLLLLAGESQHVLCVGGFDSSVRFNDGACDPRGRLLIGTTHRNFEPGHAALYKLEGVELRPILEGLGISNGMAWTSDGRRFCHIDTLDCRIALYDYDPELGQVGQLVGTIDVTKFPGLPDGMAIDADDCLWVAFYGGGSVLRFDLSGTLRGRVSLPVPLVTSCAFVGGGLRQLAITTADVDGTGVLHSGDLFVSDVGVAGAPLALWRG